MNLYELDALINSLNPNTDSDLITFYQGKRTQLVETIKQNVLMKLGGLDAPI